MNKIKSVFNATAITQMLVLSGLLIGCGTTRVSPDTGKNEMPYSHLKVMDLDQMTDLLQKKVQEYRRTDQIEPLQQGLEICLSRPNEDSQVEKTISIVRNPLEENEAWESSIQSLVDRSLATMSDDQAHSADQVTAGVVLENIISEFRPEFLKQYEGPGFETRIIEKIAQSNVEYSKQALAERKLNLMRGTLSPSLIAQKIVERRDEELKKRKKKK